MKSVRFKIAQLIAAAVLSVTFILSGAVIKEAEGRREMIESGKELKGIPFREFWDTVREEGEKWAGDRLYVSKISSGTFREFDKHSGLSPIWEAQIIKCSNTIEKSEYGKVLIWCSGKAKVIRQVESGIIGMEPGVQIKKETSFRGAAVDFDRIELSAQSAEHEANQHMRYRPSGYDNYTYDLKIDHFSDKPVWIIKKACGLRGLSERRCRSRDHWIVKVDGETGAIIRQSGVK